MFPTLKIRVAGLDPKEMYLFFLEIVPFDDKRYRYVYHR
jgi:T-box protein 18